MKCHHIRPREHGGGHGFVNLMSVCRPCHIKIHESLSRPFPKHKCRPVKGAFRRLVDPNPNENTKEHRRIWRAGREAMRAAGWKPKIYRFTNWVPTKKALAARWKNTLLLHRRRSKPIREWNYEDSK